MPTFNAEKHLTEAINSILNQSYSNFEFIIINDGSTDTSLDIINKYNDNRIILINLEKNRGITNALNIGIEIAKGKYIARMDADDISHSKRLEKQVKFLERNSNVDVLGSKIRVIKQNGEKTRRFLGVVAPPNILRIYTLFLCPLMHPSVIGKSSLFKHLKYRQFKRSEDYELWSRLSHDYQMYNLNETLLFYRAPNTEVSKKYNESIQYITQMQFKRIGIETTFEDWEIHKLLFSDIKKNLTLKELKILEKWLIDMKKRITQNQSFLKKDIKSALYFVWYSACKRTKGSPLMFYLFLTSDLFLVKKIKLMDLIILLALSTPFYYIIYKLYNRT